MTDCMHPTPPGRTRQTHIPHFFLTFTADMVRQCLEMNNARLQMVQKEQRAPMPVFFAQTVRMKG